MKKNSKKPEGKKSGNGNPASAVRSLIRNIRGFLRPGDFLIALVYAGLFGLFLVISLQSFGEAGSLLIQSAGDEYRYDLETPRILEYRGPIGSTVVELDGNGRARFQSSDCRDQICVHAGWLENGGDWAACLPNRVIIRLDSAPPRDESGAEIDATAF
ncbi:NusG domain II-containing protein [Salinispira pacifica]|uniref:Uncharacterized protein n=1 Tax=Salinispira pacifica TaxID=1307761 RepID=V5WMD7_9SPIO|nr:NusG domain II-containing protein [Salinispira pacifica]AHC16810.1 hypothetical protein L21SP2_3474 [Salinispira pacifica]